MKFRVHHIMCTNLYRGLGYNGAFCENMTQKVTLLREHPEIMLELVAQPDDICANCPNLQGGDYCANGDNHVCVKDRALLVPLHLQEGKMYSYRQLMEHARQYLTRQVFEESCGSCSWYRQGVCRYEDFSFD